MFADEVERQAEIEMERMQEAIYSLHEQLDDARHAVELERSEVAGRDQDIDVLRAVMDAAEPFLLELPEDMSAKASLHPSTTAGDCRELNAAYAKALGAHPN